MALGMIGRFFKMATGVGQAIPKATSTASNIFTKIGKPMGKVVGKTAVGGFKGIVSAGNAGFKGLSKIAGADWQAIGSKVGKHVGQAGQVAMTDLKGINNTLGVLTGGVKVQPLNNGLNKLLKTNKFKDMRLGQLIKDDPDALLFGKKFTKLGAVGVAGIGAVVSAKDAVQNRIRAQAGVNTGLASNAPVNTYAQDQTFPTMGASYANNAGATGDLALSLHRQRHSGIL